PWGRLSSTQIARLERPLATRNRPLEVKITFAPLQRGKVPFMKSRVAIVRTRPATVVEDTHYLVNLSGYRDVLDPNVDTALKPNISWHFFFPATSTTPWQIDGVVRALRRDG